MLHAIFDNHLALAIVVLFGLWLVPTLLMRGRRLRDPSRRDRRRRPRPGVADRRA